MKESKMIEWIIDYLNGNLDPQQEARFFRMLEEEGYDLDELKKLEKLNSRLDEISPPEVREQMHRKFYDMLEEQKAKREKTYHPVNSLISEISQFFTPGYLYRLSYALLFLFAGWAAGYWIIPNRQLDIKTNMMMNDIQEMRKAMTLTLLEQPKATLRLKAVNYTSEIRNPDETIITALLNTLNHDMNINVRLASLDALVQYAGNPVVREGLVQSIANQDSPLVQIALAEVMIALQEKRSVPELRKLLEKEDLNETVRTTLEHNIQTLI